MLTDNTLDERASAHEQRGRICYTGSDSEYCDLAWKLNKQHQTPCKDLPAKTTGEIGRTKRENIVVSVALSDDVLMSESVVDFN